MRKFTFDDLNVIIILLTFFVFPALGYCIYTLGISSYCFLGTIVFMIATGVVYKKGHIIKHGRKILHYLRIALLLCVAGLYLPTIVLDNFSGTKSMYYIKKLDYIHGVYGLKGEDVEFYKKLLPEKLPEECEDYSYITGGRLYSHHALSCLIFRTDDETIDSYAEYYGSLCDEIRVKDDYEGEELGWFDRFLNHADIYDGRREEFDDAEIYWTNGPSSKGVGVLLDRDSGYVVILT